MRPPKGALWNDSERRRKYTSMIERRGRKRRVPVAGFRQSVNPDGDKGAMGKCFGPNFWIIFEAWHGRGKLSTERES